MPPKPKFSKEEIVEAAFCIVRTEGEDALVARRLMSELNTTSSPIFTQFRSMDEIRNAVLDKAKHSFYDYLKQCKGFYPAFKKFGLLWVEFALNEPNLYELIFNHKRKGTLAYPVEEYKEIETLAVNSVSETVHLNEEDARQLINQMVIVAHGLVNFMLNGYEAYDAGRIGSILSESYKGLVLLYKTREHTPNGEQGSWWMDIDSKCPVKKEINDAEN